MADYPSKLKNFKAWAKAMEEGATVGRPSYGQTPSGSPTRKASRKKSRRKRRYIRKRKKQD